MSIKTIKQHLGYGFIPAFILLTSYYIYYASIELSTYNGFFEPVMTMGVLYFILFIILHKVWKLRSLFYFTGFKLIPLSQRILYFLFYYFGLIGIIDLLLGNFTKSINPEILYLTPIITIIALSLIPKIFVLQVPFTRITPRIYMDAFIFEYHNIEDINTYNVRCVCDDSLSLHKCKVVIGYSVDISHEEKYNFFEDKIIKIDVEIIDHYNKFAVASAITKSGKIAWTEKFHFTQNEKYPDSFIISLIECIMDVENI